MKCPTCKSEMVLLFTSAVCDACNPPKNAVVQKTQKQVTSDSNIAPQWYKLVKAIDRLALPPAREIKI